jgi:PhzF family phenazine biosynthesis protein
VELPDADLTELLACLDWSRADLDPTLPPRVAFAGVWHPILAAARPERLAKLDYDFDRLAALMAERDWTTVDLVHRDGEVIESRNPFPPGGVVEDPATGAAAAALGGYLRELGIVTPPARLTVLQGAHMGRPGVLTVDIPPSGGIAVTGTAVAID